MSAWDWDFAEEEWQAIRAELMPSAEREWLARERLRQAIRFALSIELVGEVSAAERLAVADDAVRAVEAFSLAIFGTRDPTRAERIRPRLADAMDGVDGSPDGFDRDGGPAAPERGSALLRQLRRFHGQAVTARRELEIAKDGEAKRKKRAVGRDEAQAHVIESALRVWLGVHGTLPAPQRDLPGKATPCDRFMRLLMECYARASGRPFAPWSTVRHRIERLRPGLIGALPPHS